MSRSHQHLPSAPPPNYDDIANIKKQHKRNREHCETGSSSEIHKHCEEVRAELKRYGFKDGHESQVCVVLDVSLSMNDPNHFYFDRTTGSLETGKVQKLIQKALSIAIELSADKHEVTIFPFGEQAYPPVVVDEHEIHDATEMVYDSINKTFDARTNYCAPIEKIREYYFEDKGEHNEIKPYNKPPLFILFITDGEPNMLITQAKYQFKWIENNAAFIKFVALRGNQKDQRFQQLNEICSAPTRLPNKHLIILDDPNTLTIRQLFENYRLWLEEAHEHGLLKQDPCINLDVSNPDNRAEIQLKKQIEEKHGHVSSVAQVSGNRHGHFNQNRASSAYQQLPDRDPKQHEEETSCCGCNVM